MKKPHFSKKAFALALIVLAVVLVSIVVIINKAKPNLNSVAGGVGQITINKDGKSISIYSDGSVFQDGNLVDKWSDSKTNSFYTYFISKYFTSQEGETLITFVSGGETITAFAPGDDELVQIVVGGDGGGGSSQTPNPDLGSIFDTPTPTPLPYGPSSPMPSPAPSWCLHWKLSYCADAPVASSTPSSTPNAGPTPLPPDCNNSGNKITGRTVISNELCIPAP